MYDCESLKKLIYPYLDGELDIKESIRVQIHLNECAYCKKRFRDEKMLLETVKSSYAVPPAPAHLRERIQKNLSYSKSPYFGRDHAVQRPHTLFSTGLLAAMIAMFVVAISGIIFYELPTVKEGNQKREKAGELVRVAVENHEGVVRGKVHLDVKSNEAAVIKRWFEKDLDFQLAFPQEEISAMRLIGGKLVHLKDKKAVFLTFKSTEGNVSLLMSSPERFLVSNEGIIPFKNLLFYLTQEKGYYALAWTDPQQSYVLVSDQKMQITKACRICHEGSSRPELLEFDNLI